MPPIPPRQSAVPSPITLLAVQAGGGWLAVLPIMSLNQFADLTETLQRILLVSAIANALLATVLLVGFIGGFQFFITQISRVGELGLCRILLIYDMLMLGSLVYCTGGSEQSAFASQFAAVLPMAILIKDSSRIKWAYAAVFLLMYLLGLQPNGEFHRYFPDHPLRERWGLIFFFIFTLFPVVYSIQTERTI